MYDATKKRPLNRVWRTGTADRAKLLCAVGPVWKNHCLCNWIVLQELVRGCYLSTIRSPAGQTSLSALCTMIVVFQLYIFTMSK